MNPISSRTRGRATRRRALGLASSAGATAFLAACGGRGSSKPLSQASASTPRLGGQFNLRVPVDPIDFDPSYNGKTLPGDLAQAQAHNTLLTFKAGPDVAYGDMQVQPKLAESWEVSPDGTSFTFHLRKGVKFANLAPLNGRELTSQDVKWTAEYYGRSETFQGKKLPASAVGFMYEGMVDVQAPDAYTVVVRFASPFLPFLSYAASDWNSMAAHEIFDQDGSLKDHLVGAGPFQLDAAASQKGTEYLWRKNASYWNAPQPYADTVQWLVLPQDASAFAAFQTKQVDLLQGLAYPSYQQLQKVNPQARVYPYLQPQGYHLWFSQAHPGPLTDLRVRQAIVLAVDRDEVNKTVGGGQGQWSVNGAMQGLFSDAEARQLQTQDLQQAKQLLAAAGYASGLHLSWPIEDDSAQDSLTWYQLVQAQLKRAGIDLDLQLMAKAAQREKRRKGDFDIDVLQALGLLEADADSMMFGTFHSRGSTNYTKIRDPELDRLLELQRSEVDPAKRRDVQRQAVRRILDMAWGVDLIYPPIWDVTQPYVANYSPHFSVRAPFTRAWLTK
jgi:peptide/nickel transport system substrate-binding protein